MSDLIRDLGPVWGFWAGVGQVLLITILLLLTLAFILLFDRKVWAAVQMRKGPNVVGPFGLLQSFADFFKFVFKEIVIPAGANKTVFILAPLISFVLAFVGWAVVADRAGLGDLQHECWDPLSLRDLFARRLRHHYGRLGVQLEISLPRRAALRRANGELRGLDRLHHHHRAAAGRSLNLTTIVDYQSAGIWMWNGFRIFNFAEFPNNIIVGIVMFAMMVIFFISALAETNRPPFDLPEAESELVAGYQVEYSSTPYLLFMVGEYLNIVLMCAMTNILFLGGWHLPWGPIESLGLGPILTSIVGWLLFWAKIWFIFFLFAMVKAIVPRYRYDQLMRLGWKIFLPTSLIAVVVIGGYVTYSQAGS